MEILVSAKNLVELEKLFSLGADAVYLGLKSFCRWEKRAVKGLDFIQALNYSRLFKKKVYAALNRIPDEARLEEFYSALLKLNALGINGVILNDPGLIGEVRARFPRLFIITSIGMAPLNLEEIKFLIQLGVNRIILPEDTPLSELKLMNKSLPVELEMFISGRKDFTFTGKCAVSSYYRQVSSEGQPQRGSAKRGGCYEICHTAFKFGEETVSPAPRLFNNIQDLEAYLPYLHALKMGREDDFEITCARVKLIKTLLKGK